MWFKKGQNLSFQSTIYLIKSQIYMKDKSQAIKIRVKVFEITKNNWIVK